MAILAGTLLGGPQRHPARNDGHPVQRLRIGRESGDDGVSRFVNRDASLLLGVSFASRRSPSTILSKASEKSSAAMFSRALRVAERAASLTRLARSAPENPGVFWATTSRFTSGASGFPLVCTPEDRLARRQLGAVDEHAPIEATGPEQRRVEHVRTVGRGDDDDQIGPVESVHLREQLVQRLLALVVAAPEAGAARAADGVDLVDEHDGRRALLGLLEEIAHARRPQRPRTSR